MKQVEINNLIKSISHDYRSVSLAKKKSIKITKAKKDLFREYCSAYVKFFMELGRVEAVRADFRRIINISDNNTDKLYLITLFFKDNEAYSFFIVANVRYESVIYRGIKFEDGTGRFSFDTSNSEASIRLDAEQEALFKIFIKNKYKIDERKIKEDK